MRIRVSFKTIEITSNVINFTTRFAHTRNIEILLMVRAQCVEEACSESSHASAMEFFAKIVIGFL